METDTVKRISKWIRHHSCLLLIILLLLLLILIVIVMFIFRLFGIIAEAGGGATGAGIMTYEYVCTTIEILKNVFVQTLQV